MSSNAIDSKRRKMAAYWLPPEIVLFIKKSLIKKSRAPCPAGRFHPSVIYQVIIITGLNKLYDWMFSP